MNELETQRLRLRYITKDDTERIFECWASDPEVAKYVTWNAHTQISQTEEKSIINPIATAGELR